MTADPDNNASVPLASDRPLWQLPVVIVLSAVLCPFLAYVILAILLWLGLPKNLSLFAAYLAVPVLFWTAGRVLGPVDRDVFFNWWSGSFVASFSILLLCLLVLSSLHRSQGWLGTLLVCLVATAIAGWSLFTLHRTPDRRRPLLGRARTGVTTLVTHSASTGVTRTLARILAVMVVVLTALPAVAHCLLVWRMASPLATGAVQFVALTAGAALLVASWFVLLAWIISLTGFRSLVTIQEEWLRARESVRQRAIVESTISSQREMKKLFDQVIAEAADPDGSHELGKPPKPANGTLASGNLRRSSATEELQDFSGTTAVESPVSAGDRPRKPPTRIGSSPD